MKCGRVEKMLSSYLDDSLKVADTKKVETHLAECQKCASYLRTMTKVDDLIKLKAKEEPPKEYWDSYWPRMKGRLEGIELTSASGAKQEKLPIHAGFLPKLRLAMNSALVVLLILAGTLLYRNSREIKSLRTTIMESKNVGEERRFPSGLLLTSQKSIEKQARLFQEIREVFPHNAQWVVTNNGRIDLGIASYGLSKEVAAEAELPIFLHFNVVRFDPISTDLVSSPKMMVLDGQEVNAKLDSLSEEDKTIYRYRCLPRLRPDGKIDIAIRISLDSSILETGVVVDEGQVIELGRIKREDAEYVVYLNACSRGIRDRGTTEDI